MPWKEVRDFIKGSGVVVLLVAGCGPSWSEYEAKKNLSPLEFCRWREQHGLGVSRKCLATQQVASMEKRDESERQDREKPSAPAQVNLAEIRANPKYPEIGATTTEAKTICTNEHGRWVDQDATVGCKVGGVAIFACRADDDGTITRCTHWLEGAELAETRRSLVEAHGQPASQDVANGYRVFTWSDGTELTGYARGAVITESKTP